MSNPIKKDFMKIPGIEVVCYSDKHSDSDGKYSLYELFKNGEDNEPDVVVRKYINGDVYVYVYLRPHKNEWFINVGSSKRTNKEILEFISELL